MLPGSTGRLTVYQSFCTLIQGSPSGCEWREIRGVSQVEKDAGKTLAPLFGVTIISESNKSWATVLLKAKRSSLMIDALTCLGIQEAWTTVLIKGKRSTQLHDLQDLHDLRDLYDIPEWDLCDL